MDRLYTINIIFSNLEKWEEECIPVQDISKIKEYIYKELIIDGLETYIIVPEHYLQVLKQLNSHVDSGKMILGQVNSVKKVEFQPAVMYVPRLPKPYQWWPILCYKEGVNFYHVYYHSGWMCRECWHDNGPVIMPQVEADSICYANIADPKPPIAPIFKKIACKNCGKMLQNHLIML